MILTCLLLAGSPAGHDGLHVFFVAVFLMYSAGYPVGHTAVSREQSTRSVAASGGTTATRTALF